MARWARFLTPSPVHRRLGLVCLGVGVQDGRMPMCGPRKLSCYGAVLLVRGTGRLHFDGHPHREVTAPALFWLRPGQVHRYGPDEMGWAETWALFDGPAMEAYAELGYLDEPVPPLADLSAVRESFARLAATCRAGAGDREVVAAARVHDLVVTIGRARRADDVFSNGVSHDAATVVGALRRDAHLPLTVPDHARRLGVTVPRLRDAVRRSAGCGPKTFLVRVRLDRAKQLLSGSDLTVAAVARRVGYDDPGYFTRIFTRQVKLSPRQFRDEQRRPEPDR